VDGPPAGSKARERGDLGAEQDGRADARGVERAGRALWPLAAGGAVGLAVFAIAGSIVKIASNATARCNMRPRR